MSKLSNAIRALFLVPMNAAEALIAGLLTGLLAVSLLFVWLLVDLRDELVDVSARLDGVETEVNAMRSELDGIDTLVMRQLVRPTEE